MGECYYHGCSTPCFLCAEESQQGIPQGTLGDGGSPEPKQIPVIKPIMKLDEIAQRIAAHLQRFEHDPVINIKDAIYKIKPYYWTRCRRAGSRIMVTYLTFQGSSSLTKEEALRYLEWLDQGNVGKHFKIM